MQGIPTVTANTTEWKSELFKGQETIQLYT